MLLHLMRVSKQNETAGWEKGVRVCQIQSESLLSMKKYKKFSEKAFTDEPT